jgi:hypothetical protein
MALTYTSPRGTDPPRRIAANDEPEKATDGVAKVDDDNITKSHDSRMMANIAKTARGPNGPVRGSDTSSPPKSPARKLVSIDLTFNTESILNE